MGKVLPLGLQFFQKKEHYFIRNPIVGIQIEVNDSAFEAIKKYREFNDVTKYEEYLETTGLSKKEADEFVNSITKLCLINPVDGANQKNWTVEWDLTYKCNLKCKHCMVDAGNPIAGELDTKDSKSLIDQLERAGYRILVISGGEPLVRADFFNILKYASNKGFFIKILSNACLIDKEKADQLKKNNVIFCQVSLDGCDKDSYENIRGKGSFLSAINGIKALRSRGVNFGTTMVLTENNFSKLEDTIKLSIELGASSFSVGQLVRTGRALTSNLIQPQVKDSGSSRKQVGHFISP